MSELFSEGDLQICANMRGSLYYAGAKPPPPLPQQSNSQAQLLSPSYLSVCSFLYLSQCEISRKNVNVVYHLYDYLTKI